MRPQHDRTSYQVGIICALPEELAAIEAVLDEEHPGLPLTSRNDDNHYTLGRIGEHHVVVACLPGVTGTSPAAVVARNMMHAFPIRIGLLVGIGGGVWSSAADVRLGDVVVSKPDGIHGGVVQYDFGKQQDGSFRRTGALNKPPEKLRAAVTGMHARHRKEGNHLTDHLSKMLEVYPAMREAFRRPRRDLDLLFKAEHGDSNGVCPDGSSGHEGQLIVRPQRENEAPQIHYGNIASGNMVMKDALMRDRIAAAEGILCFEMEAAGLMDHFPCIVIRGVCDYADSHKNDVWHDYAAAVAAAYAKELLIFIAPQVVQELESPSK